MTITKFFKNSHEEYHHVGPFTPGAGAGQTIIVTLDKAGRFMSGCATVGLITNANQMFVRLLDAGSLDLIYGEVVTQVAIRVFNDSGVAETNSTVHLVITISD